VASVSLQDFALRLGARLIGQAALVRWLLENELVDEINLLTFPVIIRQGTRLFADTGPDVALDLSTPGPHPTG
jgi:dihydrofolate reductase